jgi:hypothetical protein
MKFTSLRTTALTTEVVRKKIPVDKPFPVLF